MINFYNYLTDKKVSQSLYEMLFNKFMQTDEPTYREYTGTLPVTITANGSDLIDWVIYGNTGGVGDATINLFSAVWEQGTISSATGADEPSDSSVRSDYIPITPNTIYSFKRSIFTGAIRIRIYDSSKNYLIGAAPESIELIAGDNISIPMNSGTDFCCIKFIYPTGAYFRLVDLSNVLSTKYIMVQGQYTSETMPDYEPYGYKITILSGSDTTDIYIDTPLSLNETVSFTDTNVHIPTNNGSTVISCDNTVQPEKMYIKYIGG